MKKFLLLCSVLALSACTAHKYPLTPIVAISNEKNTDIYVNEEYQGSERANLDILNEDSKNAYVYGKKKGCQDSKLKIRYEFDLGVFWIADLNNIPRLLKWDVWKVDENKKQYNVTPKCD